MMFDVVLKIRLICMMHVKSKTDVFNPTCQKIRNLSKQDCLQQNYYPKIETTTVPEQQCTDSDQTVSYLIFNTASGMMQV